MVTCYSTEFLEYFPSSFRHPDLTCPDCRRGAYLHRTQVCAVLGRPTIAKYRAKCAANTGSPISVGLVYFGMVHHDLHLASKCCSILGRRESDSPVTEAGRVLIIAGLEALVIWAAVFAVISFVLLNAGIIPGPSPDDRWSWLLVSHRRQKHPLTATSGAHSAAAATAAATWVFVTVLGAGATLSGTSLIQVDTLNGQMQTAMPSAARQPHDLGLANTVVITPGNA